MLGAAETMGRQFSVFNDTSLPEGGARMFERQCGHEHPSGPGERYEVTLFEKC